MTQLIVICCYLAALLALGLMASRFFRGTSKDYMLASHSIGPFLLLMSLFGTTMTAFALVGSTGKSFILGSGVYGLMASAAGIVHSLCFLVIGVPLWRIGRKNGFRTQIQYFRARLDNQFIGLLLFPILVALVITYLLLGVVAAGAVVSEVTQGAFANQGWFESSGHGVPKPLASAVICLVVLTYVFFGGMRGTAWANTLQTTVFMVLGVVTFVTVAKALGGLDSLWESMKAASDKIPETHVGRAKLTPAKWFSFLFIPLSVAMFPHVFQHWLTARSASAFKLPVIMHPIFVMIVWFPCVLIGCWAAGSGIEFESENVVLARLVQLYATPLLGGLLTAGILAAIMSSLDSQFLCLGTMFTEDVVVSINPKLSDKARVWFARFFVIAVVVLTFVLSLFPRAVFDLGLWSFSGFTGLFPLVFASIYWKRLTAPGALASIFVAGVTWFLLFRQSDFGANARYTFPEQAVQLGPLVIPPMLSVVTIFVAAAITLVIVSLVTRPPDQTTMTRFFDKQAQ
ncbi:MAG: sodium:solute symporter family protein [Pirellulaceae bacterium]